MIPRPRHRLLGPTGQAEAKPALSARSSDPRQEGGPGSLSRGSSLLPEPGCGGAGRWRLQTQTGMGSAARSHLLLGDLLVGKQLVNIPVVLKAPGKEAGHARRSHSRAAWPSTATAQPRMQPPRGQTRAWPTSPLLSPWSLAGCHRQAAEIPLNTRSQCPLSKASARVQPAWTLQLQGQGTQRKQTCGSS